MTSSDRVLVRTGLSPRRLVLELTESVPIAETPTAHPVLTLRALGGGRCSGCAWVVEGVERQDQLDALAELRCDMGQGFFLTRHLGRYALPRKSRVSGAVPDAPP